MTRKQLFGAAVGFAVAFCGLLTMGGRYVAAAGPGSFTPSAQQASSPMRGMPGMNTPPDAPAYNKHAPKGPLPQTIDPREFPDALNQNVYSIVARSPKLKRILYQQPCFCHCDREIGHKSLLDCYVDRHASVCGTCKAEAIYAYEQMRLGKSAAQIRQGILAGDWQKVNLVKYARPEAAAGH